MISRIQFFLYQEIFFDIKKYFWYKKPISKIDFFNIKIMELRIKRRLEAQFYYVFCISWYRKINIYLKIDFWYKTIYPISGYQEINFVLNKSVFWYQ